MSERLDLTVDFAEIWEVWDFEANESQPDALVGYKYGNGFRYPQLNFKCINGHKFSERLKKVLNKTIDCRVCSGAELLSGFNDLATLRPDLIDEWDSSLNEMRPNQVRAKDSNKYFWKCPFNKHPSYKLSVYFRVKKISEDCSVCNKRILVPGFNDLASTHPWLVQEWSSSNEIKPTQITSGSNAVIEWICPKDARHVWKTRVTYKTYSKEKCSVCTNKVIVMGVNDAATLHPDLAQEWHQEKNGDDKLSDYTHGYNAKKHWWKCKENGHIWDTPILTRTGGSGCPKCPYSASKSENEVVEKLSEIYDGEIIQGCRSVIGKKEIDIYFPSLKLGIEFNGEFWHNEEKRTGVKDKHDDKKLACDVAGIPLFVLWENDWIASREQTLKDIEIFLQTREIPPKYTYEARRQTLTTP